MKAPHYSVDMSAKPCVSDVETLPFSTDWLIAPRPQLGLKPQFPGLWREAVVDATIPQGPGLPPLEIKTGDRIWASFRNAHLNVCGPPRFFCIWSSDLLVITWLASRVP